MQWDHPRSRGVYPRSLLTDSSSLGSSPLARGLPARRLRKAKRTGIIPARAGFTCHQMWHRPIRRDHPRSRGVYVRSHLNISVNVGSSPLARGLHVKPNDRIMQMRIIPARAGFTTTASKENHDARDHPRSRGVYRRVLTALLDAGGSSPLARGLPASGVQARRP